MVVYIIILIVSLLVFLASIGINVITVIDPNIFGKATTVVDFIVLVVSLISGFGTVYTFLLIRYEKQFIEQLKVENTYTLGHSVSFYNLAAFKSRASRLMRIGRFSNLKKYCLVFTSVSLNNVNSGYRSEEITELNYLICNKVTEMFSTGKYGYNRKLSVYGYNRGAFLIFTFAKDDSGVTRFITEMSNYIFEVVF